MEPLQTDEKKASSTAGLIPHEEAGLLLDITTTAAEAVMQTTATKASSIAGHGAREPLYLLVIGARPFVLDMAVGSGKQIHR